MSFITGLRGRLDGDIEIDGPFFSAPPSSTVLDKLRRQIEMDLPRRLRYFFRRSGGVHCGYSWEPLAVQETAFRRLYSFHHSIGGGPRHFCTVSVISQLYALNQNVWASMEYDRTDPGMIREHKLWTHSLPFFNIGNGDALAFDLSKPCDDPPILYLCHDDTASGVIAPNFDAFLHAWERLCYIGPEWWLLDHFLEGRGQTKRLNFEGERAKRLRSLFGVEIAATQASTRYRTPLQFSHPSSRS